MPNDDDYQKKLNDYNERMFSGIKSKIIKEGEEDNKKDEFKVNLQKEALKTAHDIRKFEIELYWKRTTYFWSFQGFIFAGFATLSAYMSEDKLCVKTCNFIDIIPIFLVLILTFIGVIISLAWTAVNKGSKFWQTNWEHHIDFLENDITGRLYKTVLQDKDTAPYSVSRINENVSRFITIIWVILFVITSICFILFVYNYHIIEKNKDVHIFIKHLFCILYLVPFIGAWYIWHIHKNKKKYRSSFTKNKNATFKNIKIIAREKNE